MKTKIATLVLLPLVLAGCATQYDTKYPLCAGVPSGWLGCHAQVHGTAKVSIKAPKVPAGVPVKVAATAESAARRYDVPASLLLAVADVESRFHSHAVSSAGAAGIMQIMPQTAQALQVRNVFSVRESMDGAARYLRSFMTRFGVQQAVFAYNTGHVGSSWQVAHSGYVQAVLHEYRRMRGATWR